MKRNYPKILQFGSIYAYSQSHIVKVREMCNIVYTDLIKLDFNWENNQVATIVVNPWSQARGERLTTAKILMLPKINQKNNNNINYFI